MTQPRHASGAADTSRLYVYAIIPSGDYVPRVSGIDGASLSVIGSRDAGVDASAGVASGDPAAGTSSGPRAIVHVHTAGPYDGPDDDVKRWILQHSDVVEDGWAGAGSVLPVSFNVIVRPGEGDGATAKRQLEGWLTSAGDQLNSRLEELAGTSELRVEIALDRSAFVEDSEEIRELKQDMAGRPAGVRRLYEKRLEKTEKELTDRAADQLYPSVRARVAGHCLEIEEYRKPAREPGLVPVLTAACLVQQDKIRLLGAELSAIREELLAADIRFLGPWPPYSFADMSGNEQAMTGSEE